jgi:two-component system chemotaxis response regulator CheY
MSHILSVDDSPSIRQLVAMTLQADGHTVASATNGAEALALTAKHRFDLVISDLNMPIMNGLQFLRAFRAAGDRFTPVLMLTTEIKPEMKEAAKLAGATGWVTKPFEAESLRTLVRRVLS